LRSVCSYVPLPYRTSSFKMACSAS
jgi:hypothetical protein